MPENNKPKRAVRSRKLVAEFPPRTDPNQPEFAIGWLFAVHDAFKETLDIRFTEVVKKGTKEKVKTWTQGKYYSFSEGDIIYGNQAACLTSDNTATYEKICLQVIAAAPASLNIAGLVKFQLFKKENGTSKMLRDTVYDCTQGEFVGLLKTGIFYQLNETTATNLLQRRNDLND